MKKTFIKMRGGGLRVLVGIFALLALLSFVLPQAAQASTAANTVIRNEATVNYNDTAGTPMTEVKSHVDITVTYVCATPTFLSAPPNQPTDPNVPVNYTYTITSHGNGSDTYNLSTSGASYHNIAGATFGFYQSALPITTLTLGATTVQTAVTIAAGGTTVISVPNDNSAGSAINDIAAGDTVVISGAAYTVASIVDNGLPIGGISTITVNGNGTGSGVIPAGTLINERQVFDLRVTPGVVSTSATVLDPPTITVTANATGSCSPATDETITTVRVATLTILKEVTTTDDCSGGWATSGSFPPGDTVCYRLTIQNKGNSNAIAATVTDPMPDYTTYVGGSTLLNAVLVTDVVGVSRLVTGLQVDDVAGRLPSGSVGTGILPPYIAGPAGEAIVIFKVTIN